jgi:hypothetical protein
MGRKYEKWRRADQRAHEAEMRSKALTTRRKGVPTPDPEAEKVARALRAAAESLFDEAMVELEGRVAVELDKRVRRPNV